MEPGVPHVQNGGNFFLASHGVRIQAAANSLIIWRPALWHGTSLSYQDPKKPSTEFAQRGLAFVTSSRLPSAWERYRVGILTKKQAEALLLEHEPSDEVTELSGQTAGPSSQQQNDLIGNSVDVAQDQSWLGGSEDEFEKVRNLLPQPFAH